MEPLFKTIPRAQLVPWKDQIRSVFNRAALESLVRYLKKHGQGDIPLVVRPLKTATGGEMYEVVVGERRRRAAKEAGLTELVCLVRDLDDRAAFDLAMSSTDPTAPFTWIERLRQIEFL